MIDCCYVYCLRDPETQAIYYVGSSINPILRYAQHTRHHAGSDALRRWVKAVQARGLKPAMEILETLPVVGRDQREAHWIRLLLKSGEPLLNFNPPTYLVTRSPK